jgi:curved DNA-binding protein CbpA
VITLGDLKHAQIEKLRQWHPDVTKENKNLATEMCARINEAHEKISNRIKS